MTTPSKIRQTPWCEDDTKWFSSHPGRIFRFRRVCEGECSKKEDHSKVLIWVQTHVVVMQGPGYRYTLLCNDGAGGALFDLMLRTRDEMTDDVCAAIWGKTIFNGPWGRWQWEDVVEIVKLHIRTNTGQLRREWLS